jgi:hypothetical protein
VTAQAAIGAAKASPVSVAAGQASTAQAEVVPPNAHMYAVTRAAFIAIRMVMNIRCPRNTSAGRSGKACAAM